MQWPEKPTCHDGDPWAQRFAPQRWRAPRERRDECDPYHATYRTCSYCGCIHPEDLIEALGNGARLGGSDWKYSWPHKFYVEGIPNPIAGAEVVTYSYRGEERTEYSRQPAPATQSAKWYNEHLLDAGYDLEAFQALCAALTEHTQITFDLTEDGRLRYSAPYFGYQASGYTEQAEQAPDQL